MAHPEDVALLRQLERDYDNAVDRGDTAAVENAVDAMNEIDDVDPEATAEVVKERERSI